MSRWVVDTSAYSWFQRNDPQIVRRLDEAEWIGIPIIVIGELDVGFRLGSPSRLEENRSILRSFTDHPLVETLGLDPAVAELYSEILARLRGIGKPVPTNDLWIAACAARAGSPIITYDQHFDRIDRIGTEILTPPE